MDTEIEEQDKWWDTEPDDEAEDDKPEPDWVCEDCVQAIAYDDFSALDYHYEEKEAARREKQIRAGVYTGNGYWVLGDDEDEFSKSSCDCCGYQLAGRRNSAHYIEHNEGESV